MKMPLERQLANKLQLDDFESRNSKVGFKKSAWENNTSLASFIVNQVL